MVTVAQFGFMADMFDSNRDWLGHTMPLDFVSQSSGDSILNIDC
jgi:hypothetical protein